MIKVKVIAALLLASRVTHGWAAEPLVLTDEARTQMRAEFAQHAAAAEAELTRDPQLVRAYSARGDARLFLGEFRAAVADFEKMIALDPTQDAPHWRLGIAYYFAGDFAKAARQFEKYHAYDGRDRENGIWKFLAQAKADGIAKARAEMLAYTRFDREPFPSLYEMLAGKKTPDEMLAEVAKMGRSDDEVVMFFAHYYGGLEEDLLRHRERALKLLGQAVASPAGRDTSGSAGYMWQVARLHWERLRSEQQLPNPPSS